MDAVLVFDLAVRWPRARWCGIGASMLVHVAALYALVSPALDIDCVPGPSHRYTTCPIGTPELWTISLLPPPPPPPPQEWTAERLPPQSEERGEGCGSLFARVHDDRWTLAPKVLAELRARVSRVAPYYGEVTTARATGARRATSSIEVCLDRFGEVTRVDVVRSSGLARWDDDLVRALERFHERPCAIVQEPTRACAAVDVTYDVE